MDAIEVCATVYATIASVAFLAGPRRHLGWWLPLIVIAGLAATLHAWWPLLIPLIYFVIATIWLSLRHRRTGQSSRPDRPDSDVLEAQLPMNAPVDGATGSGR